MKIAPMLLCVVSSLFFIGCATQSSKPTSAIQISEAQMTAEEACDVALDADADQRYGGIKQEYVVNGCKVTIYNDGPIQMVNEKTDQPCDAPIPKDHQFSKITRIYQENGCTITEYEQDAVKDCSMQNQAE